jgi:uncharacterized protein (TIGR02466 family)
MKDIKCFELFKTPGFLYDLDINTKALNKFCYNYKKKHSGRIRSNRGSYQSNFLDLNDKCLKTITTQINQLLYTVSLDVMKFTNPVKITDMWFNINYPNGFNLQHNHPQSILSGVFYTECSKQSGNIVFIDKDDKNWVFNSNKIKEFNQYNSTEWTIEPKTNSCIVFPAWLQHYVEQNQSKKNRISFSFNAHF